MMNSGKLVDLTAGTCLVASKVIVIGYGVRFANCP